MQDASRLGVVLSNRDASMLIRLLDELERWNRAYNLTAIRDPEDAFTHHLLDSLSIHAELRGGRVADVGTGAGFPGLPLAIANPHRHFTLIDSNGKKIRFVRHAIRELGIGNVAVLQMRVEACVPEAPFDSVVARAFAPLPALVAEVGALCDAHTRVIAMKGKWPQSEIDALPSAWRHEGSHELHVPGLAESRCVIVLSRQ